MMTKEIRSTIGRELNVTSQLVKKATDQVLSTVSSFTDGQVVFMMVLECDRSMEIIEIQHQFGLLGYDLGRFLGPLLEQKLIIKENDREVSITEKGTETIGKLWTTIKSIERRILRNISSTEENELRKLLKKMQNNCISILDVP